MPVPQVPMRFLAIALALILAVPAHADETDPGLAFTIWLNNYRTGAESRGLKREWLDAALAGVRYVPRVVQLDRGQPDDPTRQSRIGDYLARQLGGDRISGGIARVPGNRASLLAAATRHRVAPEIIMAIWGMETSYGRVTGGFDLPSALATLAYDGRRASLFTAELDAAVRIVGEGRASREQMRGSWAGALGQPQFLPSNYLKHGADGDGDGRIDLWASVPDTFMSIARYFADAGWVEGLNWGFAVGVPPGFDHAPIVNPRPPEQCTKPLSRHSYAYPAARWRDWGFRPLNGVWPADTEAMALVEPDGPGGDAYLTTANYRVIMEYNCSNYYALSVALLGNALAPATR
ncbi:MAG: lytic transglycosylase [Alphaproteobacteria bacterium PA4]|nr:MAG: lytic transglycosylase [Alphaproteobacteria bacterium PA4]